PATDAGCGSPCRVPQRCYSWCLHVGLRLPNWSKSREDRERQTRRRRFETAKITRRKRCNDFEQGGGPAFFRCSPTRRKVRRTTSIGEGVQVVRRVPQPTGDC